MYPFLSDYRRVWEMDLAKDAYHELQIFFRTDTIPTHQRINHRFERPVTSTCSTSLARIQGEV